MPIKLVNTGDVPVIFISGITPPHEGDELLELLREYPGAAVDLSEMEHLHTALLQMLLVAQTPVTSWPIDDFWQMCLNKNIECMPVLEH